jgi:hypothetical protein
VKDVKSIKKEEKSHRPPRDKPGGKLGHTVNILAVHTMLLWVPLFEYIVGYLWFLVAFVSGVDVSVGVSVVVSVGVRVSVDFGAFNEQQCGTSSGRSKHLAVLVATLHHAAWLLVLLTTRTLPH